MTKYLVKNKKELQEIIKTNSKPLTSLDVSNIIDMSFLFSNISNVTFFDIDSWDTSSVSNMGSMFEGCSSLITIPLLDTSNVTSMGSMFYNCSSLKEIPLLNTSSVSSMYRMFEGCSSLTTLPLLDTSNVSNMYRLFEGCSSLTTLPLLDTSNVTNMGYTFSGCSSLPLVDKVLFLDKSNNNFKRQIYLQMSKEQLEQTYDNLCV